MPTDHVEIMEGRFIEQKRLLLTEVTRVSVEVLGGKTQSMDGISTKVLSMRLIGRS